MIGSGGLGFLGVSRQGLLARVHPLGQTSHPTRTRHSDMAHTIKGPKEGLKAWVLHWVGVLDGLFVAIS